MVREGASIGAGGQVGETGVLALGEDGTAEGTGATLVGEVTRGAGAMLDVKSRVGTTVGVGVGGGVGSFGGSGEGGGVGSFGVGGTVGRGGTGSSVGGGEVGNGETGFSCGGEEVGRGEREGAGTGSSRGRGEVGTGGAGGSSGGGGDVGGGGFSEAADSSSLKQIHLSADSSPKAGGSAGPKMLSKFGTEVFLPEPSAFIDKPAASAEGEPVSGGEVGTFLGGSGGGVPVGKGLVKEKSGLSDSDSGRGAPHTPHTTGSDIPTSVFCSPKAVSSGGPNKAAVSSGTGAAFFSGTGTAGALLLLGTCSAGAANVGTSMGAGRLGRATCISSPESFVINPGLRLYDQQKGREKRYLVRE